MAFALMLAVSSLITTVVMIFLSALLLWVTATHIFKVGDKKYKTALMIAAIVGAVSWVLGLIGMASATVAIIMGVLGFLISIALGLYLVKTFYKLEWGKAALVWLVWFVLALIAGFIIGLILAPIYLALGLLNLGL